MTKRQYGAYKEYAPGQLPQAIFDLATELEQHFPGQSATWIHKAPGVHEAYGTIAWKIFTDTQKGEYFNDENINKNRVGFTRVKTPDKPDGEYCPVFEISDSTKCSPSSHIFLDSPNQRLTYKLMEVTDK